MVGLRDFTQVATSAFPGSTYSIPIACRLLERVCQSFTACPGFSSGKGNNALGKPGPTFPASHLSSTWEASLSGAEFGKPMNCGSCQGPQSTYPQGRDTAGMPCLQAFSPAWLHSSVLPSQLPTSGHACLLTLFCSPTRSSCPRYLKSAQPHCFSGISGMLGLPYKRGKCSSTAAPQSLTGK